MPKAQYFCFLILILFFLSCEEKVKIDSGVSYELAKSRKSQISKVHYDISVNIPKNKDSSIWMDSKIIFDVRSVEENVALDFKGGQVGSFLVNGEVSELTRGNEHLIIQGNSLKKGSNTLEIKSEASDLALNRNEEYMFSLFVPDRASSAFPCFDQPDIKATYGLKMKVPAGWQAIGNGLLETVDKQEDYWTYEFKSTKNISSYQFAFVAGDFQVETVSTDGFELTLYHREDDSLLFNNSVTDLFDLHFDAVKWMEDYTEIDYPFSKLEFIAIPGFPFGGMEHVGAIQYRADLLFLDKNATVNQKLRRASLIAHEVAHMWFGNLVTMEWFNDVWMKEVFANFIADKIVEESFPEVNHDLNFLFAHYPSAYSVDRTSGSHPIQQQLDNLNKASNMYGSIIYHKAPIAMKQLELVIGENAMRLALAEYLENYLYDNAGWDDLMTIVSRISGRDMTEWSEVWIKRAGRPFVELISIETPSQSDLIVNQRDLSGEGKVWPQTWNMTMDFIGGPVDFVIKMEEKEFLIQRTNKNELPAFFQLNSNGKGYGVFVHGLDYVKDEFIFNKARVDISGIENDLERGAAYLNLHEYLLHEGFHPQLYYNFLEVYLEAETNDQILSYLLDIIQQVFNRFFTPELKAQHIGNLETTIWNKLNEVESQETKSLLFNAYIDIASTEKGIERLKNLWEGVDVPANLNISKKQKESIAISIALKDLDDGLKFFQMQIDSTENEERRDKLLFIQPVLSSDAEVRSSFVSSLMQLKNREKENWVLLALKYLHHNYRNEGSQELLLPTLELLEEMDRTGSIFFVKGVLDRTMAGYNSFESAEIIKGFLAENPNMDIHLRRKLLQSADMVFRAEKNTQYYQSL